MNRDFLRRFDLFAGLSETDLDSLARDAEPLTVTAHEVLIQEGAPGDSAYVILDGEFEVIKKSEAQDIVIAVREPGEVFGEMALLEEAPRAATVRAVRESRVLKISGEAFQQMISGSPSAALAILKTVSHRLRQNEALLRQSEKMAALGTLAAGLAHELNNPAAAVRRSAAQLQAALKKWTDLTTKLARSNLKPEQSRIIDSLSEQIEVSRPASTALEPQAQADRESALLTWIEAQGWPDAWELAPALASVGWQRESIEELRPVFEPEVFATILRWLAVGSTVYTLLDEIGMGTERMSEIVRSVKAYSYLDQGAVQEVDLHQGLENTLVILRHKMTDGIQIQRKYALDLPQVEAHGSELNQVWTNILDNSIDAMEGHGVITLRTCRDGDTVQVEIEDDGPGIPAEIQKRIFEPFFTTKPPGSGTGLGLHIAYTIINNHNGKIRVTSRPGRTCFQITLPTRITR
jgi:signal transduction histidine kinase